jgi:hypothetical protein
MSELISLDTTATIMPPRDEGGTKQARFIIGPGQLVIAESKTEAIRIDLDTIFDITVGPPPTDLKGAFEECVTIGYTQADAREMITFEPKRVSSEECANMIVREVLTGEDVVVRVSSEDNDTNEPPATKIGRLIITGDELQIDTAEEHVSIALEDVRQYQKGRKTTEETIWPTVEIHYRNRDTLQVTELAMRDGSDQQLLGRYIESEISTG